jgi:outer membrane PBP1 activator LpoA protein
MTIAEMRAEIISELTTELQNETDFDAVLLEAKVDNAIREVQTARNYPSHYVDLQIENDTVRFFSQIKAIALFDYNQIGAEGQTQYSADGESIHYVDRNKLFYGIVPLARI